MNVQAIFTPYDTPTVTYVDRAAHKLEQTLRDHYHTPKLIVSVSGPSKSGKTVAITKVVPEEYLIKVAGSAITSAENLWDHVLAWMGAPSQRTITSTTTGSVTGGVEAGGKIKVPFVAEGAGKTSVGGSYSSGSATALTYSEDKIAKIVHDIGNSDYVVFIDDFHYIRPEIREEIGRQIKAAAEAGIKIFTASVPHRSDDVVRSNPELAGRVAAVDFKYWTNRELEQIVEKGFQALNLVPPADLARNLSQEAFGSPQLMQSLCLNLCYTLSIREVSENQKALEIGNGIFEETFLKTSAFTDFSRVVSSLHTGPRVRGTERKTHSLKDGSKGDVYRTILLAIKQNPGTLSFDYREILDRVRNVCVDDTPVGSSVTSALEQMNQIAEETVPGASPLSWDNDRLDIVNPYLLFFLRSSTKLADLTSKRTCL